MWTETNPLCIPPQALEAEQATLGSLLIAGELLDGVCQIVMANDFYREAHRLIFAAILTTARRDRATDLLTVRAELERRGKLETVGGLSYLQSLQESVPTTAHCDYYAQIVADKALLRRLIRTSADISSWAHREEQDAGAIVDRAEQSIFRLVRQKRGEGLLPVGPMFEGLTELFERSESGEAIAPGMPTGISELDELTTGMQPGDLDVLAGRPGTGKTSAALQFAVATAEKRQMPVAIFSLEMNRDALMQRMVCAEARVDSRRLRNGKLQPNGFGGKSDFDNLISAAGKICSLPIHIDEAGAVTPIRIRARARRLAASDGLGLIVVDYLQRMHADGGGENRHLELGEVTNYLKAAAMELRVPILLLSQLVRLTERRADKRPVLSDLADSGRIEADADGVWFLYRPNKPDRGAGIPDPEVMETVEIIVEKARSGGVGTVNVGFVPAYTRFENLTVWR